MERLTKRTDDGKVAYALLGPGECVDVIDLLHVWGDRLAAYEDIGLEPEEINSVFIHDIIEENRRLKEFAQAEKDGRLVVLPCKLGQMVWAESPVRGRTYSFEAPDIAWIIENTERFGKEIFLTREEAEAALKKREAGNEAN